MPSTLKKYLEVVRISRQLDENQLETKILSIFEKVRGTVDPGFVVDCHRLGKNNDRVIITNSRRKYCKQVLQVKKDLQDLNTDDLDLPRDTKIFVNRSLCSYYHILWFKSKRLYSMGIINRFFSRPLAVTHLNDFTVRFPNVDLSPPSASS